MRVEMIMSGRGNLTTVLDWFVHRDEEGWFLTISDIGDRIRSVAVEVSADPRISPVAAVAELWHVARTLDIGFDLGGTGPAHIQSEIRVKAANRLFWYQASTWIWQDSRVVAYRSHPTICSRATSVPDAPPEEIAESCFDFAATLEMQ